MSPRLQRLRRRVDPRRSTGGGDTQSDDDSDDDSDDSGQQSRQRRTTRSDPRARAVRRDRARRQGAGQAQGGVALDRAINDVDRRSDGATRESDRRASSQEATPRDADERPMNPRGEMRAPQAAPGRRRGRAAERDIDGVSDREPASRLRESRAPSRRATPGRRRVPDTAPAQAVADRIGEERFQEVFGADPDRLPEGTEVNLERLREASDTNTRIVDEGQRIGLTRRRFGTAGRRGATFDPDEGVTVGEVQRQLRGATQAAEDFIAVGGETLDRATPDFPGSETLETGAEAVTTGIVTAPTQGASLVLGSTKVAADVAADPTEIDDTAAFLARRGVDTAQFAARNPVRFAGEAAGGAALGATGAAAARGSLGSASLAGGASVTGTARSAGSRLRSAARNRPTVSGARRAVGQRIPQSVPEVRVTRDADAGFIEVDPAVRARASRAASRLRRSDADEATSAASRTAPPPEVVGARIGNRIPDRPRPVQAIRERVSTGGSRTPPAPEVVGARVGDRLPSRPQPVQAIRNRVSGSAGRTAPAPEVVGARIGNQVPDRPRPIAAVRERVSTGGSQTPPAPEVVGARTPTPPGLTDVTGAGVSALDRTGQRIVDTGSRVGDRVGGTVAGGELSARAAARNVPRRAVGGLDRAGQGIVNAGSRLGDEVSGTVAGGELSARAAARNVPRRGVRGLDRAGQAIVDTGSRVGSGVRGTVAGAELSARAARRNLGRPSAPGVSRPAPVARARQFASEATIRVQPRRPVRIDADDVGVTAGSQRGLAAGLNADDVQFIDPESAPNVRVRTVETDADVGAQTAVRQQRVLEVDARGTAAGPLARSPATVQTAGSVGGALTPTIDTGSAAISGPDVRPVGFESPGIGAARTGPELAPGRGRSVGRGTGAGLGTPVDEGQPVGSPPRTTPGQPQTPVTPVTLTPAQTPGTGQPTTAPPRQPTPTQPADPNRPRPRVPFPDPDDEPRVGPPEDDLGTFDRVFDNPVSEDPFGDIEDTLEGIDDV